MGDLKAPRKVRRRQSPPPVPAPIPAPIAVPTHDPARRPHDGTRTRVDARVAFPTVEEEEEIPTPNRRFTLLEVTSGLPDASREEDERQEARRLRDVRGRVKRARAVVANTPGLAEILAGNWKKAAMFYARYGITELTFRLGVPVLGSDSMQSPPVQHSNRSNATSDGRCMVGLIETDVGPTGASSQTQPSGTL